MKFYDREAEMKELNTLCDAAEKRAVMVVLSGVRRVGKTELIIEFFRKNKGIYFFVDSTKTSNQLLGEFSELLSRELGLSHLLAIRSWDDFFEVIFTQAKEKRLIVAFDEFQRFAFVEPSIPFILQKNFDLRKKESKLLLMISGSSFGLLKTMFIEEGAPLFQRPANILRIRPFGFRLVCKVLHDLGIKKFDEKVELYSFFGGIPKFYEQMELYNASGSQDALDKLLFRQDAPLRAEVRNIISEEFGKQSPTYYGILTAIAIGKTKANEIADYAEIMPTSLPNYLYDLTELLGVVGREIQVTESQTSKKVNFMLSNSFFRFWFRFIYPKESDYELGRYEQLKNSFEGQKESFVGKAFEEICREALVESGIASKYQKIGRWWGFYRDDKGERKTAEIDIVALDKASDEILFCECKWRNRITGLSELLELKRYSELVEWKKQNRKEKFIMFSKSGFDSKAKDYAKENGWTLFDLEGLQKIFE